MVLKTQISIIGCGWLGLSLANHFIEKGYFIKGSTTSKTKIEALEQQQIKPFLIQINESEISGDISSFLKGSETLIINIPPGLRQNPKKNHVTEIKNLVERIEESKIKNVLYISSTSVYNDDFSFPNITEKTNSSPKTNSGKQLITIEKNLKSNSNFNTTILRFSGLFDENRHPGKNLSERKNISNPKAPVNLIHKNDCISIISKLIENNIWNQEFYASNPYHPSKKEYYTNYCKTNNLPLPEFNPIDKSQGKYIDATKLVQLLTYNFKTGL